jgi:hypothetical protein
MNEEKKIKSLFAEKLEWKKLFNYNSIVKNIPFLFFLSIIAILYIYNGHYADKLIRKIGATEKNVKELEYEYKTLKSEVIYRSKPSEMIRAVEPMGLKELKEPAMILNDTVNTNNKNSNK